MVEEVRKDETQEVQRKNEFDPYLRTEVKKDSRPQIPRPRGRRGLTNVPVTHLNCRGPFDRTEGIRTGPYRDNSGTFNSTDSVPR